MITRELLSINMSGTTFSPSEAKRRTELPLVRTNEPGETGERGRYKNKPTPFGGASLDAPDETPDEAKLAHLLDSVLPHAGTLRQLGVEEMVVYVGYFWRDQCNLSFQPEDLSRLAALGVPFWISCYEDSDESSPPAVAV